jgi:nitroimidazol reductase NimA-like FMN-containing flavoprotein (pyridoxamine 5'-phosphate oxidase superfamily)
MVGYLTREESETILRMNTFGRIGCNDGFNTFIYPTNYVYDGKVILCHSMFGEKILIMRENSRVCFQVDLLNGNTHWKSIMIHGSFKELEEERERLYAMKIFNEQKFHLKISEKLNHPEMHNIQNDQGCFPDKHR